MMKHYRTHSVIAFVILCGAPAEAANRYVRAGASGTHSGLDWTNAYPALPPSLVRGDVYYIADGTYGGYTFDDDASEDLPITIRKATADAHGTDAGWSSEYGDGVAVFNGPIRFRTNYWVFDGAVGGGPGSWTTGHGFRVVVTSGEPILASGSPGGPAGSYLRISHVEAVGNGGVTQGGGSIANDALAVYGGTNITLSHAYLHDAGRCIFFLSGRDLIVEYSYTGDLTSTSETHAELASIWGFSMPARRITFRYNMFTGVEGTGGIIMEGDGLDVYGNVFYRPTGVTWSHGNGVIGTWSVSTLTNAKVYNNSFVNVENRGPVFGTLFKSPTTGNEARNNLFYSVALVGLGSLIPTYSHNHYVATASGDETGKTIALLEPFVGLPAGDFRLSSPTQPGATLPPPYDVDMFGATRGADGIWDRGAFEFEQRNLPPRPPTPPKGLRVVTP